MGYYFSKMDRRGAQYGSGRVNGVGIIFRNLKKEGGDF